MCFFFERISFRGNSTSYELIPWPVWLGEAAVCCTSVTCAHVCELLARPAPASTTTAN